MDITKNHDGWWRHQRGGNTGLTNQGGPDTCVAVRSVPLIIKMAVVIINHGSHLLLSPHDVPGTLLRALLTFPYLLFLPPPSRKYCFYLHFTVIITKAQKRIKARNLSKITQVISGQTRTWVQAVRFWGLLFNHCIFLHLDGLKNITLCLFSKEEGRWRDMKICNTAYNNIYLSNTQFVNNM